MHGWHEHNKKHGQVKKCGLSNDHLDQGLANCAHSPNLANPWYGNKHVLGLLHSPIYRFSLSAVLAWQCDSVAMWDCGYMAWLCDSDGVRVTVWLWRCDCGGMTVWLWMCDSVSMWDYDRVPVWRCGSVAVWSCSQLFILSYWLVVPQFAFPFLWLWTFQLLPVWAITEKQKTKTLLPTCVSPHVDVYWHFFRLTIKEWND